MKIKQVVTVDFSMAYCNYNGIDFTDANGNEVCVRMTDAQLIEFHDMVNRKVVRVKKEQLDAARERLEKEEVADE